LIEAGAVRYSRGALSGDPHALTASLRGCDSLVHLSYRPPQTSTLFGRFAEEVGANLLPTMGLLGAAEAADIGFVIFASSVAVYGKGRHGVCERDPPDAATPYAASKLVQELCVNQWARRVREGACVLRLATVYGPGETVSRAIPNFIRAALAGSPPVLDGKGAQPFDVIYVSDVADAFVASLERRAGGVFNIGTGVGRTARQLAELIIQLCGARLSILENPAVEDRGGPICDVSHAASALGFMAVTALETGLREEIGWLRRHAATTTAACPASREVFPIPVAAALP
jgi:nucleoside-diphosphate-sugar epimerase